MKNKKNLYYIGGGLIAYFLIISPLLKKLGILKTSEEKERENEQNKFLDVKGTPTKSPGEWSLIADQIHENLRYSALDDDKASAGYQVTRVKNMADFALLFKMFGKRREYFFGIPSGSEKNLQQFINNNLDQDQIRLINDNYKRKGISFQY